MFKCVLRCYRFIKYTNSATENSSSKMFLKVSLMKGKYQGYHFLAVPLGASSVPSSVLSTCKKIVGPEEM